MLIAIHGGAGNILPKNYSAELKQHYLDTLKAALQIGFEQLQSGKSAIEAVRQAIVLMENAPIFNAGKGSVFSANGVNEMDASIMCGRTLNAGAVSGVSHIKNPIVAAQQVMLASEHVLLTGKGAEAFAVQQGVGMEEAAYFFNQKRYDQWKQISQNDATQLDHDAGKYGTVGAVALDTQGNLAAGTSTGGMTNKKFNRIGDSPIIGAGTYANNKSCAVSCTGHGEYFMRNLTAYDVHCLMEYKDLNLPDACREAINKIGILGGKGGLIAIDNQGNYCFPFNSSGMFRGVKNSITEKVAMFVD